MLFHTRASLFFLLVFGLMAIPAFSQKYNTAMGIRVGNSIGVTAVQRFDKHFTVEGIVHKQFLGDAYLTVLARRHIPIIGKSTNLYFGVGANSTIGREAGNGLGLDAVAGAEVSIGKMNFSLDYKPMYSFASKAFENQIGISARVILIPIPKNQVFSKKKSSGGIFNSNQGKKKKSSGGFHF